MALTQLNQLAISFKKLAGKAHTNSGFGIGNEAISSILQVGSTTIFGEPIPTTSIPSSLYGINGPVEKIRFQLTSIAAAQYTATNPGGLAGATINASGDGAPSAGTFTNGVHAYKLTLPSDYVTNSSNPGKGTVPFTDSSVIADSAGGLQIVPDSFAAGYSAVVYDSAGVIFPGDQDDYYLDYSTGVLFVQDIVSGQPPIYVEAYLYIGKYLADPTLNYSGSFSGSFQGNGSGLTNLPASSIVGLNLTQIADSQVSASVSATGTSFTVSSASVNLITVDNSSRVTATTFSGSLVGVSNTTGSLTGSFVGVGSGSFSGSFQGNGSGLTNLPASSIVGLNLSQTATGSVSASVNVGTTSFQVVSGSTTLLSLSNTGTLTVSGSELIGNNITAVGNAIITGSLTVNGATTLGSTTNITGPLSVNNSSSLVDTTITGSLLVTQNFTVLGTASFSRITGSNLVVGTNLITLNTDAPAIRFGGITVIDSGSFGTDSTGSLFWDSERNHWIYANPSASSYDGGGLMSGPRNTAGLGNETYPVKFSVLRGQGGDHLEDSNIYSSGSNVTINKGATGSLSGVEILGAVAITGSTLLPSPDGTVTGKYALVTSQSAWHYSDNIGYPVGANQWGTGLNGSYFNLFNPNTDTATIMRFIAGLLSASAPAPTPNTKTYGSLTNNNPSFNNSSISGYVPQDISGSDLLYLNDKGFANTGSTIFNGVGTVYTTLNPTYNFSSVFSGSTTVSSSADAQLFGLGATGLTFNVSGGLNWRFDDNFSQTSTATSSSQALLSSPATGLTVTEISTANPAVIPNAFQDGKFTNIFAATFYNGGRSLTSVSSSGWYHVSASIGYSTGSSPYTTFNTNFNKVFAAPISNIESQLPTQTITFTQSVTPLTATSRSLSGAPYLQTATWAYSITSSGVFEPLYFGNSTIFNISDDSSLVSPTAGTTSQVMSGGTISGTSIVYDSTGATQRTGIPFRTDRIQTTLTETFTAGATDENINQIGLGTSTYTITSTSYNRSGTPLATSSLIPFHQSGTFGQPSDSRSMAYNGRSQGSDPSLLTSNSETFLGETYRLKIDNTLLTGSYQNGTKFTTGSYDAYNLGGLDLQVKPGYLVRPGSNYGYWLADPDSTKTYKFYARSFRVTAPYSSLYIDIGKTLNNWTSTSDGVSVAIIFNSVFANGNLSGTFGNSNPVLFDVASILSTGIEANNQANDNFINPFSVNINVYGNVGGTVSSTKYGIGLDSGTLKQVLNPSASPAYVDFVVLVRYTNQNTFTPITTITQTNS